jgi:pantoate--beta-alanine ligase
MLAVDQLAELRAGLADWRATGQRIGLVPTMGNLHKGHLDLVRVIGEHCDRIVVSIFVNPTQFGPEEDFQTYPRTLQSDQQALERAGCDLVWMPEVDTMYPLAEPFMLHPPESLTGKLCGLNRPGHFTGVASVVLRLFNQVTPEVALFGEKDFQQLLVIRSMVRDLSLPIDIRALPTVRESDGLAMSSRNQYLSASERRIAPLLYHTLTELAEKLADDQPWDVLKATAWDQLERSGFQPQYLEWLSGDDLGSPQPGRPQRLLAAARLGKARLIDNVELV